MTKQRLAIFDAAVARTEHFTAEQLLDHARALEYGRHVSRATVYRTLPVMTESALLREVDIGSGEKNSTWPTSAIAPKWRKSCAWTATASSKSAHPSWNGTAAPSRPRLNLTPVSQRLQVSARCNLLRDTGSCPRRN